MEIENVSIKTEHLDEDYCIIKEELDIKDEGCIETANEKPYKCGICGHRTTTDTLLKVHMKMHLVKRIHQCNICKKTFHFVTELNSHILTHTEDGSNSYLKMRKKETYVNSSLNQSLPEDSASRVSVSVEKETERKRTFKNHPNSPLNHEEKLLLLHYVEELGLNKKYLKLEQIKNYVRNSWMKMVELFAKNDYDRNSEKLIRTYFHLKNQAKRYIERFYKDKRLPDPREIDYMFVKLCPNDFEIPGVDIQQVIKDSKKIVKDKFLEGRDSCKSLSSEDEENDYNEERVVAISEDSDPASPFPSTFSQKRTLSEEDEGPLRKLLKSENRDFESCEITRIKLNLLLAEKQTRERLHNIELKEKEELFNMEKKHKEAIYKKELEIKNLELALLRQKMEIYNRQF